jgi:hypothetical protein
MNEKGKLLSGQKRQTVNLLCIHFVGSNPTLSMPARDKRAAQDARAHETSEHLIPKVLSEEQMNPRGYLRKGLKRTNAKERKNRSKRYIFGVKLSKYRLRVKLLVFQTEDKGSNPFTCNLSSLVA